MICIANANSRGAPMRLSAFTDYGLRALMRLSGAQVRLFTTDELAADLQISRNHLTKVVRDLSRAGYVRTQRGARGGLRLLRPPQSISLGEVVRFLERRHAIVECFRTDGDNAPSRRSAGSSRGLRRPAKPSSKNSTRRPLQNAPIRERSRMLGFSTALNDPLREQS
jgi:Rrf2 family protein